MPDRGGWKALKYSERFSRGFNRSTGLCCVLTFFRTGTAFFFEKIWTRRGQCDKVRLATGEHDAKRCAPYGVGGR